MRRLARLLLNFDENEILCRNSGTERSSCDGPPIAGIHLRCDERSRSVGVERVPRVSPDVLKWARETAGLGLEEAAQKIALHAARGKPAATRLAALETGDVEPSRALLSRMAQQYRRPLLVFYLSQPPTKGNRGQDFRVLPADAPQQQEAILDAMIRTVLARQALLRSALEEVEEGVRLPFVGSATMVQGVASLVSALRNALGISLDDFRRQQNPEDAFRLLRSRAESTGVFVLLLGNLGSHHTALGVDVFRGFALADPIAPFLVINDQDSRAAWSFTLVHELAHLWLGETGISGGQPIRELERFCNDIASEFLLPARELAQFAATFPQDPSQLEITISEFALARNISRSMVAYRLHREGLIGLSQWQLVSSAYRRAWIEQRKRRREAAREQAGGPNYYTVRRHRIGDALLGTTARLLRTGAITTSKAARILDVRPNNVGTLLGAGEPTSRAS